MAHIIADLLCNPNVLCKLKAQNAKNAIPIMQSAEILQSDSPNNIRGEFHLP